MDCNFRKRFSALAVPLGITSLAPQATNDHPGKRLSSRIPKSSKIDITISLSSFICLVWGLGTGYSLL